MSGGFLLPRLWRLGATIEWRGWRLGALIDQSRTRTRKSEQGARTRLKFYPEPDYIFTCFYFMFQVIISHGNDAI
jgi:hypothetical protein